ncbi:hypothetical protein SmJEL517_g00336 [Synchytrium microbalum]|uniref:Major facilitator superfamily (MFS) profile domain-containing protein n=1 Tax=Synchytrium microbalum TaxID=1806994 RepID=A0A507CF30_9FUNG|nr:uncharacterized protein SmJEL517_g00336 [Synchytrium microbalum]TPX38101.1 hypothetical protein SmJEL517_g00336 [Synchytrium microbalum]
MSSLFSVLIAIGGGMGGFLFGYEIGIIDQILVMDSFKAYFNTPSDLSVINGNITALFLVGCVAGALAVAFVGDVLGRKRAIFAGGCVFSVGAVIQTAAQSLGMLYGGRVISGISVGVLSTVVPVYIAESSSAKLRGTLTSVFQLLITFGILVASCVNTGIIKGLDGQEAEWRTAFGLQLVPGALLLLSILFLPESPRFLAMKGKMAECLSVLARILGQVVNAPEVQAEFREIEIIVERDRVLGEAKWSEIFQRSIRPRIFLVLVLQTLQQWTGINVILYYAGTLFQDMGFSHAESSTSFVIANAGINFLATFPALYLVERVGRKTLLIVGGAGIAFSHTMVTICLKISQNGNPSVAWGAIIFVYLFIFFFAITWGPVAWVYQSEILPLRVRSKGTGLGTVANWVSNAIIAKISPIIATSLGAYQYLIYAGMGVMMTVFAIFFIPETKGVELEDMAAVFGHPEETSVAVIDRKEEAV